MQNAVTLIAVYRTGFYICAVITLAALFSAGFMFFKFDIRTIFAIRTGRAERVTVERMQTNNQKTGALRLTAEEALPAGGVNFDKNQTTLLHGEAAETVPLKPQPPNPTAMERTTPLSSRKARAFRFVVTENRLIIHTDERI